MAGLLDDFGQGLISISAQGKQDKADQRELDMYEKKQQLQNDLTIKLEERKKQLAAQYPEFSKVIGSAYGSIITADTAGNVNEITPPENADIRAAYIANKTAPMFRAETGRDVAPSVINKNNAQAGAATTNADANTTRAEAAVTRASRPATPKAAAVAKPATATQALDLQEKLRKAAIDRLPGRDTEHKRKLFDSWPKEKQDAAIEAITPGGSQVSPSAPAAIDYNNPFGEWTKPKN